MSRSIANSTPCIAFVLSISLVSCHTAIKNHAMKYSETVGKGNGKNLFWYIKNSDEILNRQAKSKKLCLHHLLLVI